MVRPAEHLLQKLPKSPDPMEFLQVVPGWLEDGVGGERSTETEVREVSQSQIVMEDFVCACGIGA